jgi:hypothetical protein
MGNHTNKMNGIAMRHRGRLAALIFAMLATVSYGQLVIQSSNFREARVSLTVTALFSQLPQTGYMPVKVEIENQESRAYGFQFNFTSSQGYYRNNSEVSSRFGLSVEPGKSASTVFLVPLSAKSDRSGYGGSPSLRMEASAAGLTNQVGSMSSNLDSGFPCTALSTAAARLDWDDVKKTLSGKGHSGRSGGEIGARFAPSELPTDWLGYSGFDTLVISQSEWGIVSGTARKALLDWVRMGGNLIVLSNTEASALADLGLSESKEEMGFGNVILIAGAAPNRPKNPVKGFHLEPSTGHNLNLQLDYTSGWSLQSLMGERNFNVGQIIFILIVFAILVGPVNLFVLAKPGKRHRLFFTTPLISIAASLILAGLIVVQDGFGGSGMRNTVTLLDYGNNQALTVQEQLARSGVLLSRSFQTEEPVLIHPLELGQSRWTFVHSDYNAPSTNYSQSGNNLSGDYFRSRSEQAHILKKVSATRENIEQTSTAPDGAPEILSSIATPLEKLAYIDESGKFWLAENIGTGAKVVMSPADSNEIGKWINNELSVFGYASNPAKGLFGDQKRAGRFFAKLKDTGQGGFATATLDAIDWVATNSLVIGKMKNAAPAIASE